MMNKYSILLCYVIFIFVSCNISSKNETNKKTDSLYSEKSALNKENRHLGDTNNFLEDCRKLTKRSWEGSLQGISRSKDSAGYLCFSACYDCQETYEMIFVFKGGVLRRKSIGYDSIWASFRNGCDNKFKDFDCFVFVLPIKDPEKQDDIHKTIYTFPEKIKVYKQMDSIDWRLLYDTSVTDFGAYGNLRFETIYKLD
jgi:hypothetical protein